jgi:uncharacterized protein with PQ loop repeat
MTGIDILLVVASATSAMLSAPQAYKALKTDDLSGISVISYSLVLLNATLWIVWAVLSKNYLVGAPGLVNGPAAALILYRCRRFRDRS